MREFRQQEARQEDDGRTEDDRQVGVQRAVETVEGRTFVDQRRETHPRDGQQSEDHGDDCVDPAHGLADDAQQEQSEHAAAEDRRQLPPCVQHAVDAHHQQPDDDAERADDERGGVLFGKLLFREPFGEVGQYDGRRGVDARGDGRHAGREERCDDQSGQSGGQSVDDEPREDLIGRRAGGEQFGPGRIIGKERRADVDEDERDGDVEQTAEECRFHGFGRRFGGHIALYVVLVDAVVLHIDEKAVDQHHPEGRFGQRQRETAEAEFAVCRGDFEELSGAFGQ